MSLSNEEFQEKAKEKNKKVTVVGTFSRTKDKILVRCNRCGREYYALAENVLVGKGCDICARGDRIASRKNKLKYENVKVLFEDRGYTLLTKEPSSTKKIHFICPKHGEMTIGWNNFSHGAGCRKCADEDVAKRRCKDFNVISDAFAKRGYTLLSKKEDYHNSSTKLYYLCPKHGEQQIEWSNFRAGKGCPECAIHKSDSRVATGLKEYCKKKYPDTITEYRVVKNPKTGRWMPYDIYIPSEKIFCEVMGGQHYKYTPYFHRDESQFKELWVRDEIKEDYACSHGRYIEIDLRKVKTVEDAIKKFEGIHHSWISQWASLLDVEFPEINMENYYGKYGLI